MKFLFLALFAFTSAHAGVKEIYLPLLECGHHEFLDVTVKFEDTPMSRKELTVGKLCEKLALKLLRRPMEQEFSRFVADEMAPKELDKFMPRANDFFRMVLFKKDIIRKTNFDFTDDS